jgi:hypothetical protein
MENIIISHNKEMLRQDWQFKNKMFRIGNTFERVDIDYQQLHSFLDRSINALLHAYSMYGGKYQTPAEVQTTSFSEDKFANTSHRGSYNKNLDKTPQKS